MAAKYYMRHPTKAAPPEIHYVTKRYAWAHKWHSIHYSTLIEHLFVQRKQCYQVTWTWTWVARGVDCSTKEQYVFCERGVKNTHWAHKTTGIQKDPLQVRFRHNVSWVLFNEISVDICKCFLYIKRSGRGICISTFNMQSENRIAVKIVQYHAQYHLVYYSIITEAVA